MAEEDKQRQITAPDSPGSGRSSTGRAVALARLLHHECTRLLQLYKERETFLVTYTPDEGRLVSLSHDGGEPSAEQRVRSLHQALRQCLGLIHCVILKEEEEWGATEGDYETTKNSVRVRLEYLLLTTKDLVETEDVTLEVTPDHRCTQETDGGGGAFALKMWTYRVLLELIHWAERAAQALHVLHEEREGTEEM